MDSLQALDAELNARARQIRNVKDPADNEAWTSDRRRRSGPPPDRTTRRVDPGVSAVDPAARSDAVQR